MRKGTLRKVGWSDSATSLGKLRWDAVQIFPNRLLASLGCPGLHTPTGGSGGKGGMVASLGELALKPQAGVMPAVWQGRSYPSFQLDPGVQVRLAGNEP